MNDLIKVINFLGNKIGSGGIESFVTNMSEGMRDNGVDYIICVNYRTDNIYEHRLKENGAQVVYLCNWSKNYVSKLIDFCKYVIRNKDAVLYLHASTSGMYLHAFLAKCIGIKKVVYHVHSTPSNMRGSIIKELKDVFLNIMFSNIPQINVACSKDAGDAFFKRKDYIVVHNGIDVDRFKYDNKLREMTRKKLGVKSEFLLAQIGRFSPQKNQFFTLKVFRECIINGMNLKLILIGEGQYENGMRDFLSENNLEQQVTIIQPKENIEEYYMAADLLMFPSEFEGLGIVVLEAQTAGLPVLASSCIVDEVCFTDHIERIDLDKPEKWIEKIRYYANSCLDREELSLHGYQKCINKGFSINNSRSELLDLYKCMLYKS